MAEALGQRLRVSRVKAQLTQEGLGHCVGMSPSRLSAIERGHYPISRLKGVRLMRLADVLGVSIDYLVGRTDKETPCLPPEEERSRALVQPKAR